MNKLLKTILISIAIIIVLFLFGKAIYVSNVTTEDLNQMFDANFDKANMFEGERDFNFFSEPIYSFKGPIANTGYSGRLFASKGKNLKINFLNKKYFNEMFNQEIFVNNLNLNITVYQHIEPENNLAYYPRILVKFNNKNGYYGIYLTNNNLYDVSTNELNKNDLQFISDFINIVFLENNDKISNEYN